MATKKTPTPVKKALTSTAKIRPSDVAQTAEIAPTAPGEVDATDSVAKAPLERVKEAIPSVGPIVEDVKSYVQDHADIDVQAYVDEASAFVRRNPGTSLAAAAGLGVLIGILATKRS